MRIGMVCPYSFDVHGGVQAHVLQLAEVMQARGHYVSVLAPSSPRPMRRCPTSWSPAARPSRSRTTARWPGCVSGPRRTARSRGGSPRASSTCCTCTSPTRRACRCWRCRRPKGRSSRPSTPRRRNRWRSAFRGLPAAVSREDRGPHRGVGSGPALADGGAGLGCRGDPQRGGRRGVRRRRRSRGIRGRQVGAVPGPLRRTAQRDGGAAGGVARAKAVSRGRVRSSAAATRTNCEVRQANSPTQQ